MLPARGSRYSQLLAAVEDAESRNAKRLRSIRRGQHGGGGNTQYESDSADDHNDADIFDHETERNSNLVNASCE